MRPTTSVTPKETAHNDQHLECDRTAPATADEHFVDKVDPCKVAAEEMLTANGRAAAATTVAKVTMRLISTVPLIAPVISPDKSPRDRFEEGVPSASEPTSTVRTLPDLPATSTIMQVFILVISVLAPRQLETEATPLLRLMAPHVQGTLSRS